MEASESFPAKISEIEKIYEFISFVLSESGIDAAVETLFKMAADEIFSNIVNHGFGGLRDGDVKVSIQTGDGEVSMTFRDRGRPFDPMSIPAPDISLGMEERLVGGLGVYIVRGSFDEVRYSFENGFNVFAVKKRLHGAA
ncbi:MAG: ATP-binding protein [Synergistaceae bacterium]|jgi:anti-sigma regulatory factor (Ser/Thr protein kinase)|nr:ATP-binding protein [Synergistaceae bacterium]